MARRHNWNLIGELYLKGYSSSDLAVIFKTSDGTISRGLRERIVLRKSGVVSMPEAPNQFSSELNEVLREEGYYDVIFKYYDSVVKYNKAATLYRYMTGRTQQELADYFGIGKTQIYKLLKGVEEIKNHPKVKIKIEQAKGNREKNLVFSRVLASIAQNNKKHFK